MADLPLVALTALFAAWWLISACNQIRSGALTARLRRYIPFSLIPLWTFFAPNPARADVRLVWREEDGGAWGDWQELHFGFAPARSRWLVNPELILNKAVTDLVYSLLRVRPDLDDRSILLTSAYVTLLSIVVGNRRHATCSALQFAVVRSFRSSHTRQVDVAFVSEVHDLADTPAYVHAS
jgi:hypothetical protein